MRRKSVALTIAIVAILTAIIGSSLTFCLHHEPAFYLQAAIPLGAHRNKCSGEFVGELARLFAGISDKRQWDGRFTADQINSYCQEDLLKEHSDDQPLPRGISEPRIALDPDRI